MQRHFLHVDKKEIFLLLSIFSISEKQFFKKNLEDRGPFCGATDIPVFYFWCRLPWVSFKNVILKHWVFFFQKLCKCYDQLLDINL